MYKIGILSDTHGLLRDDVKDILSTCNAIIHCGDFHTSGILEQLKQIAPTYAVRGNVDKDWASALPLSLSMELFGIKFYVIHNKKLLHDEINDRDIIIYGHSHKYEEQTIHNQTWLNPGSCGKRRFLLPVTMATASVSENGSYSIERIDFTDSANGIPPSQNTAAQSSVRNMKKIVIYVMKQTDKGKSIEEIAKGCQISEDLAAQICRLYVTHPGVSADGILGKMGL